MLTDRDYRFALVLSGGNALGAFQAGAYQALLEHGLEPDHVSGASTGAINGAIICGNPVERRFERLRALWRPAETTGEPSGGLLEESRRTQAALWTMAMGRPDLFAPRHLFGPMWNPFGNDEPSSLYDTTPLARTLEKLIDFDLLDHGSIRFTAAAVDIETGEDVIFDTRRQALSVDHLRASAALLPTFPPVEIDGRLLGDAGLSANLPLDAVLSEEWDGPLLCIAIDLLPLRAPRPQTLGETVIRAQDLQFATQSRRALAAWQAIYGERALRNDTRSVTVVHLCYSGHDEEVSGKAFDFSPESCGRRWRWGHAQMLQALEGLRAGAVPIGVPGLSIFAPHGDRLQRCELSLAPVR